MIKKYVKKGGKTMFDSHVHTKNSIDGINSVMEMANMAIKRGLTGIAITDHANINAFARQKVEEGIKNSIKEIEEAQSILKGKLLLTKGIELGQPMADYEKAEEVLAYTDFDFVIGAVHAVRDVEPYYKIEYAKKTKAEVQVYFEKYLNEILEFVQYGNFDVLAHLTYPLRYSNGICGCQYNFQDCYELIEKILKGVIEQGKGIEINVSGLSTSWGHMMPEEDILKYYHNLGGEILTIGTDSHIASNVGVGLKEAMQLMKDCGFHYVAFYQNRKPEMTKIEKLL